MANVWLLVPWCIAFSFCHGKYNLPDIHNSYLRDKRQAARFDNDDSQEYVTKEPAIKWDCGVSLSGPNGEVILPTMEVNGAHFYHPNYKCRWSLSVTDGRSIMLSSLYFDLEESPNDCEWGDYLEIREGSDKKSVTSTSLCGCGPVTYISLTNKLFLYFHSDESTEGRGFHFQYKEVPILTPRNTLVCNSAVRLDLGSVVSTRYEGTNQSGLSCFYRIQAPEHHVVWMEQIKIEGDSVLKIYDGKHTHVNILKVLSNGATGSQMSSDRSVLLHYKESQSKEDKNFKITFSVKEEDEQITSHPSLQPPPEVEGDASPSDYDYGQEETNKKPVVKWDCGVSLSGPTGEVILPTVEVNGAHFYHPNYKCRWSLSVTDGRAIMLSSLYFDLEESPNSCEWDYLEIRDGSDNNKSQTTTSLCGYGPVTYISMTNKLFLYFRSDESYESKGFHFEYKEVPLLSPYDTLVCNSTIRGENSDSSSIVNTEYRGSSQSEMSCFYRIQAPEQHVVWLEQIKIESISVLTIYDGKHTHVNPMKIISKGATGSLMSSDRSILLHYKGSHKGDEKFQIDFSFPEEDEQIMSPPTFPLPFEFEGDADCSNYSKDSPELQIKSPRDKFGLYPDKKHCVNVFLNKLDPNAVIQAEFLNFELEESENCTYDYVAIYFGVRKESPSLGKFCGQSLKEKIIQSTGNILKLEFNSDDSYGLTGYDIKISIAPRKDCPCPDQTVCVKEEDIISCIEGNACKINKCANGGTCVTARAKEICYCLPGTSGDTCQVVKDKDFQPLYFIDTPESELISKNHHYIRTCRVNVRDAQFRWYHDNMLMTGAPELGKGILDIDNFAEDDEGEYTCVAISGTKYIEHYFKLLLVQTCNLGVYDRPVDTSEEVGHKVLLKCYFPLAVSYTWYKDKEKLNIEGSSRHRLLSGGYLEIRDLYKTDAGLYTCEGKGESGCVSFLSAVLNVTDSDAYKQTCGISAYEDEASVKPYSRISGGQDTESRIGPWHVMLINKRTGAVFCGGTLISKSWIVTAAHCIQEFESEFGYTFDRSNVALYLGSKFCGKGSVIRSFRNYIVHESYDRPVPFDNDVAVIKMDEIVDYKKTDEIKPICLEPEGDMNRQFFDPAQKNISSKTLMFGCGYIDPENKVKAALLQVVEIPIVSRAECRTRTGMAVFTENMICGGSKVAKSGDMCKGDSGGGWVMRIPGSNRWALGGIASWGVGKRCDVEMFYSFYTHVGKYYNWIATKTNFLTDM